MLLVGSIVIVESNTHSLSSKPLNTTKVVTSVETIPVYVTHTVQNVATSTVFVPQPIVTTVTSELTQRTSETTASSQSLAVSQQNMLQFNNNYILAGGDNGTWFTNSQFPQLVQISLSTHNVRKLDPVSGSGSIWGGNSNGTEWLISGYGGYSYAGAPNPFIYLYNGTSTINDTVNYSSMAEWNGGDIFSMSSNGSTWFLSGMGSGELNSPQISNHFSAGLFNGTTFTDLSSDLPQQMDGILYASAFGDNEWLVGGGYEGTGVLFSFNGTTFTDLTSQIAAAIPEFHSVQSIAWNGHYWLIGGTGFLAMYNNSDFIDLTPSLNAVLPAQITNSEYSVNSICWNGSTWLLGGGEAVSIVSFSTYGWLASYNSMNFSNLVGALPSYATQNNSQSSVLSIAYNSQYGWIIGGYSGTKGMLLTYNDGNTTDLSSLAENMRYVIWVGTS